MADLNESSTFEAHIYQLETTDPVLGGRNGISNKQAAQLANRTQWLKNRGDQIESAAQQGDQYLQSEIDNITSNGAFVPAGAVLFVIGSTPPRGYLKLNGATLSRTTYAALWAFAQNSLAPGNDTYTYPGLFGSGDGSTTFQLPDVRGWFPRFAADGSNAIDPEFGRQPGQRQLDNMISHSHNIAASQIVFANYNIPSGTYAMEENRENTPGFRYNSLTSTDPYNDNGSGETRPRNIGLLGVIKY